MLGGVLGWALSEHNARLANVESAMNSIAEAQTRLTGAQARVEGEIKAIHERLDGFAERVDKRLDRIETNIDRLIQLYLDAETTQPAARRGDAPRSTAGSPSRLRRRPRACAGMDALR